MLKLIIIILATVIGWDISREKSIILNNPMTSSVIISFTALVLSLYFLVSHRW